MVMRTTATRTDGCGTTVDVALSHKSQREGCGVNQRVYRKMTGVSALVALTLLLGACTTDRPGPSEPSPDRQLGAITISSLGTTVGTDVTDTTGDGEIVSLTNRLIADDARFLLAAKQTLIARCMKDRGFLYIIPVIPDDPFAEPPRRYWGPDPESASQVGYGIYDAYFAEASASTQVPSQDAADDSSEFEGDVPPGEDTGDPHSDYLNTLSEEQLQEWMAALTGTGESQLVVEGAGEGSASAFMNTDGCVAVVEADLYGDLKALLETDLLIQDLRSEASAVVRVDQRFAQAQDAWLRCMRSEGFEPEEAGDAYSIARAAYEELPLAEARKFEIEVATTDLSCVEESGVNRTYLALQSEADDHIEEEHAGVLLGLRELQEEALDRAKQLLADE